MEYRYGDSNAGATPTTTAFRGFTRGLVPLTPAKDRSHGRPTVARLSR